MIPKCSSCNSAPVMVTGILKVYKNGDPLHMIELLTEMLATSPNLHDVDRVEVGEVINLLTAVARQREQDYAGTIAELKIPA